MPHLQVLLLLTLLAPSLNTLLAQTPLAPSTANVERRIIMQGKIFDAAGRPIGGITVELVLESTREQIGRAVSDADGNYLITGSNSSSMMMAKISGPNCNTVLRKGITSQHPSEPVQLNVTLMCFEPVPPMKEHKKSPGVSYKTYVGTYQVTTESKGTKSSCSSLQLTDLDQRQDVKCRCGNGGKLEIETGTDGCQEAGCWQVKEDGDIAVAFPCGVAFAGSNWILWREGTKLLGQGTSWSDVGSGGGWDISLTEIK